MNGRKVFVSDCFFTIIIPAAAFVVNSLLVQAYNTKTMTPMIFVLGVFLVSWRTQGYIWGIAASLISVLAVNWAFTYPYWAFDLISPQCISSAVVMLFVSVVTGTMTTRLKKQEKLKAEAEKERMRGNLLRAVSHDLRTPLTSIYGSCSVMMDNYDDLTKEKQLELLSEIRNDAKWLNRMVENLLSVTRVDEDTVRLSKQSTPLEELIDTLLVKFRKHYPQQKVIVRLPEEFLSIPMDAMLMMQVLMNLLENAVFHARGMEHLWLTVERNGNKAVFTVADDGCGIAGERLPQLFRGFADSAAPADGSRTNMGIGLSVCSTIVKAHGGEIQAGNRPEGGAYFRFALALEEQDHVEQ